MEKIIEKVLEMYRLGCEIDEQVRTCGIGESAPLQWHIYEFEDFEKVAAALNNGKYYTVVRESGDYPYSYEFTYRGVHVFCLDSVLRQEVSSQ